ncbi:MAG TPA: Wzz/FepE/Etk N-terminal domain-containing protein [Acidimicrobiia bacterium]|nr:Wzz/FepE/Etk N-terminal domain-containing protein [Acidimicrobiia bacterium]
MTNRYESQVLEPNLWGAVRDRRYHIIAFGIVFAALGVLVGIGRQTTWSATASVVVEDPRLSTVFEASSAQQPERYVETQIGVLQSAAVAERASEIVASDSGIELSADEIVEGTVVSSEEFSDLISVTFTGSSPEEAEAIANSLVKSYLELRQSQALTAFAAALGELDRSIREGQDELRGLEGDINELLVSNPLQAELDAQYRATLERLTTLTPEQANDPALLSAIATQLDSMRTVLEIENQSPELAALVEEQRVAISRLSDLESRHSQLTVDAELAGAGVVFQSNARPAVKTSPGLVMHGLMGLAAGLLIGFAFGYGLELRRRRFSSATEPELVLRAPLLGVVPMFDTGVASPLPVLNTPQSEAAEAFRFVMAAVESQLARPDRGSRTADNGFGDRVILVTSAAPDDGRTTVVANAALAAAASGKRVMVVDADFAELGLTELFLPDYEYADDNVGLTEVVVGSRTLGTAVKRFPLERGTDLDVLSRGSDMLSAQDVFGSSEVANLIAQARQDYDLVLIDSPPLHEVGYATTLAGLADRVIPVVRHRSLVSSLDDLRRRLALVHSRSLGYVYTKAPVSGELRRVGKHADSSHFAVADEIALASELERISD